MFLKSFLFLQKLTENRSRSLKNAQKTEYVSQLSEDSPRCFLWFWAKQGEIFLIVVFLIKKRVYKNIQKIRQFCPPNAFFSIYNPSFRGQKHRHQFTSLSHLHLLIGNHFPPKFRNSLETGLSQSPKHLLTLQRVAGQKYVYSFFCEKLNYNRTPKAASKSDNLSPHSFLRVFLIFVTEMVAGVPFYQSM